MTIKLTIEDLKIINKNPLEAELSLQIIAFSLENKIAVGFCNN